MSKGRNVPDGSTDHAAALRERLGRVVRDTWVAWAQEQPDPKPQWLDPWEALPEPIREVDRRIAWAVLEAITTGRRGLMGHFEIGSGYSMQRQEPYVEAAMDISPTQFSPAKAREMGLLLIECAEAAESDALIVRYATEALGLEMRQAAQLLNQFRETREQRRGGKVSTA